MTRRVLGLFCVLLLMFSGLMLRVYQLSQTGSYATAARNQSSYLLEVDSSRGKIYDCQFSSLVEQEETLRAAVTPSPEAASVIFTDLSGEEKQVMLQRFEQTRPFVMEVSEPIYNKAVQVLTARSRYAQKQLAANVIGYVDGDGTGVTGIEQAYNDLLSQYRGSLQVRYTMDAAGRPIISETPQVVDDGYDQPGGVVLSIDKDIQQVAETSAAKYFKKGAVVVMDIYTGELKALASLPAYDPNDVAKSLNDPSSPLIDRTMCAFNVGSVFKPLVEATAVEHGILDHTHDCPGYMMVGDVRINCHNHNGHGMLDMRGAMEKSCNPYFISLIDRIGGESVVYKAQELGFGRSVELAPGLSTAAGTVPTFQDLKAPAETANLGFGQGKLSATPIQIAQLVASIANGGAAVEPKLVLGFTQDGKTISQSTPVYAPVQVIAPAAAERVRQDMVSVVDNGSGKKARPYLLGAGGKTGSAQTGRYDENGSELVHAWFAGFYPAEDPQYAIVVLAEEMDSGGDYAAPVFAEICNSLLTGGKL